jgi:crotonobetainyl-CoA:carnitine CoA-transferase CaiB-like acyl-CoA transferase
MINPRLVYCSISGYGQTSSRSHHPSYDLIVQGESGLMDLTGFADGAPTKAGISLADVNAGNLAFEGILLALLRRGRTGKGDYVDISLLDAMASLFTYQTQMALSTSQKARRMGNRHPSITPYETFATKDGYINIAVAGEGQWKSFCARIGAAKLAADGRFAVNALRVKNRAALEKILVPILRRKPSKAWLRVLKDADVPAGKLNSLAEMLAQPDMRERAMIVSVKHRKAGTLKMVGNPIRLTSSPLAAMNAPPLLGEDTESVLSGLGYSKHQIGTLRQERIV